MRSLTVELIEEAARLADRPMRPSIVWMPARHYDLVKKHGWERGTLMWIKERDG
jgi:hypothetical protein